MDKNALAEITYGILQRQKSSLYMFPGQGICLLIWAADSFDEKYHKPAPSTQLILYRHIKALRFELHVRLWEKDLKKIPTFALFPDVTI